MFISLLPSERLYALTRKWIGRCCFQSILITDVEFYKRRDGNATEATSMALVIVGNVFEQDFGIRTLILNFTERLGGASLSVAEWRINARLFLIANLNIVN